MRKWWRSSAFVVTAISLGIAIPKAHGGNCYVNDPNHLIPYGATIQTGAGQEVPTLCGSTVEGTGTGCTLEILNDASISSGECLKTVGKVRVEMNGHTINCSGSCTNAIRVHTSAADLVDGIITGCWQYGVYLFASNSTSTISDFDIDLAPTGAGCSGNGDVGIGGNYGMKTITRVSIGHADAAAIDAASWTDVIDSIIHDNQVGIAIAATSGSVGTDISGSLLVDNNYNIKNTTTYTGGSLTDSTIRGGSVCNFADIGASCVAAAGALQLGGINFIDNAIVH